MCGIVGYIGQQVRASTVMGNSRRPEYRDYDSTGLAALDEAGASVCGGWCGTTCK